VKNLSLRTKLLGALLGVGLLTLLATGWQADRRAEAALRQAAVDHLTSIREERRLEIEAYFAGVRRDGLRLAESPGIAAAMREFTVAHRAFEAEVARWPQDTRARSREAVERYYRLTFLPRLRALESESGANEPGRYLPASDVTIALQALFIVDNPNPEGARDRLDRPTAGGRYAEIHAQHNAFLRSVIRQAGYEDLFLIDHETGRIVYTVAKKLDFGTSLVSGPYRNTRLSRVFRAARVAIDADFVQLVDFESYAPSLGAPSAFVAAPVFGEGRRLGVVALQIPLARIDAVMTGDRKWRERGLGQTGETYLVGPDHRMRSDSRFLLEGPEQYLETMRATGVPADVLRLMRAHLSTVLFQQITTADTREALSGRTGTFTERDYRGQPVLASYAPLAIPDLRWGIVAKRDTAEAFAPALALRRALLATGAGVAALVLAGALLLARSLTAPIRRLIAGMGAFGHGDLSHRIAETRGDEIGQIATAFNRMADELQQTTVSRDHLNSILDAMGDAVIVVRPPDEGTDWRHAVITTANPAACAMLGHRADEVLGQPVGNLISAITSGGGAGDGAAGVWLEEVLRHGHIGGREVVYKIRDGRDVPVLFSSAVMRQGTSGVNGVVCAAHDLTDLKAMEARGAFIRETFGRYVSDEVVASLLSSPEALALGGELRKVTVMMSDLRGFTALAERLSPQDAIAFLNGYLQTMVDLILQYRGTINEIMGDGILVIFGAPTAAADDAERAVACALAMQLAMDGVNARGRDRGFPEIEMGIGIHTGDVIVGNIGSDRRKKYAAVGTHVNLTGRIESYTTGGQILISESTRQEVASLISVGRGLSIEAKGARQPVSVWEVTGIGGAHALFRRPPASPMILLAAPIPIRYAVLEGKHVGRAVHDGSIVRLSEKGAEIHAPKGAEIDASAPPPPYSNVKIWIPEVEVGDGPGELYAKVVDEPLEDGAGFVVRFTAMAPELARYVHGRLE
jgi:PAS domain S-box-containing protein